MTFKTRSTFPAC